MAGAITLLGPTGFTGRLAADHLARTLAPGRHWTIAGRRRDALERIADELESAGGTRPETAVVDTSDAAALGELAERSSVLASAVGPYLTHGATVVAAAAEHGTDYVDLTGEPEFVDRMWLAHHETAVASGARLVHACGFDSVPYDLGVLHAVSGLPDDRPIRVSAYLRAQLGPSAGTYHSALNQLGSWRGSRAVAQQRREREARPAGRSVHGGGSLGRSPHTAGWAVPLPTIDPQIVLRSARALPAYGPDFTYRHFAQVRTTRMLLAAGVGLGVLALGAQIPPVRRRLMGLRAAGTGPTPAERERAWFTLDLLAECDGRTQHTRVSGNDPGYGSAGIILAESALCLADDDLPQTSGQTTTAVAMGTALIDRLAPHPLRFETISD